MSAVLTLPTPVNEPPDGAWKKWLILAVIVAVVAALVWWAAKVVMSPSGSSGPKRQTVKIAVLPDTPPPPPPPKPDKPPEPEKQELKPQMQQEQPKPQEAPPAPAQLKMDGPAGDGPSAFAAGQVSTEYKGGEVGTGTGGGINKLQFALFTSQLQRHIQLQLAKNTTIKLGDYRVNVQVWLTPAGDFQRVELLSSTGETQTDEALQNALNHMAAMRDVPANLPQPVRLRITNRMTG